MRLCLCLRQPRFHDEISALMFELVLVLASLVKTNQASASALRSDDGLTLETKNRQGSYRSWKTWKIMELKYFSFQAWKVMEFNWRSWKVMENYSYVWYVNYCRRGSKDKIKCRRVMSENIPKTRMILKTGSSVNIGSWKTAKKS